MRPSSTVQHAVHLIMTVYTVFVNNLREAWEALENGALLDVETVTA